MNWLGLVLVVLCAYLAFRLVGALLKIAMFVLALVGAYWLAAPHMGWPTVSELFYVLGPDFGGKRIEEVVRPSAIADEVAGRVVDEVVERVVGPQDNTASPAMPEWEQAPAGADPVPPGEPAPAGADQVQPLPEPAGEARPEPSGAGG